MHLYTGETRKITIWCKSSFISVIQLKTSMQSEIFQAFICYNCDDYGLQI